MSWMPTCACCGPQPGGRHRAEAAEAPQGPRSVVEGIGLALSSTLPLPTGRSPVFSGKDDPFSLSIGRGALGVRRDPGGCTLDLILERDEGEGADQALIQWADWRGLIEATDQEGPGVIARDRYGDGRGRLAWTMQLGARASDTTFIRVDWRLKG